MGRAGTNADYARNTVAAVSSIFLVLRRGLRRAQGWRHVCRDLADTAAT